MTPRDFVYWLQGYFELSNVPVIGDAQVECIQKHIALVRTTEPQDVIVGTIENLLRVTRDVAIIQTVVGAYFQHVIDPQHPDQDAANAAHFSTSYTKPQVNNALYRC